ncbi:hypothetical protein ACN20G_27475 (plasmid) [Streptomyces sp. BI20]
MTDFAPAAAAYGEDCRLMSAAPQPVARSSVPTAARAVIRARFTP